MVGWFCSENRDLFCTIGRVMGNLLRPSHCLGESISESGVGGGLRVGGGILTFWVKRRSSLSFPGKYVT
ncbi:unnamed protein product [Arabidopsis halleri]